MFNKATNYLTRGKYDKALALFKKLARDHEFKEIYLNMGNTYKHLNQYDNAAECYLKAADPKVPFIGGKYTPEYPLALNNLGLLAYSAGDDAVAIELYKRALTVDPMYFDAIWNHSNATLRQYFSSEEGSANTWMLGWRMYDYRFKRESGPVKIDESIIPWDRVSPGNRIVVLTEQGLGDKIMFGRYIHLLQEKFSEVYVQCHPSLDCFFNDFKIVRYPNEIENWETDLVSVPICSLAGIFGLIDENWLDGKFGKRQFDEGFNIGVVWAGSTTHSNNHNRSVNSSYFSALSDLGKLYSLNPDALPAKNITKIGSLDWSETAASLNGLDLIVSVDTSIVHLAGTLGIPTIMLQPIKETDFRWGLGHSDTPWYDSVRIINHSNWDVAFKKVRECIKQFQVDGVL